MRYVYKMWMNVRKMMDHYVQMDARIYQAATGVCVPRDTRRTTMESVKVRDIYVSAT